MPSCSEVRWNAFARPPWSPEALWPLGFVPSTGGAWPGLNLQLPTPEEARQSAAWRKLEAALLTHYYKPDLEAARALYSAFAAHMLPGPPVWPMVVAPPGSMKTELVEALDGLTNVYLVDTVTPHTFLSGQIDEGKKRRKTAASWLHRIGPTGILVCADFSTVICMNRDHRASVLADLRRIYDGHLHKEFGTPDHPQERDWRGRITFIAAATPDVDAHYSIFTTLGERFVIVRWHRPGGIEAALTAMNQDRAAAKAALREAVHGLFKALPAIEPRLPGELQHRIAALCEFVVRARTHVPRSGYSKDIIYVPEPEAATRLAQQLAQLAKGSAVLAGSLGVNEKDYMVARRAGLDCIPATRRRILRALIQGQDVNGLGLPGSTLSYALEELQSQELLDGNVVSSLAQDLLRQAGIL